MLNGMEMKIVFNKQARVGMGDGMGGSSRCHWYFSRKTMQMFGRGAYIRRQKEKRKKSHYYWKAFEIQKDLIVHCELLALNEHPNWASTPPDMTGERNMCCTCHFAAWVEGECNVSVQSEDPRLTITCCQEILSSKMLRFQDMFVPSTAISYLYKTCKLDVAHDPTFNLHDS